MVIKQMESYSYELNLVLDIVKKIFTQRKSLTSVLYGNIFSLVFLKPRCRQFSGLLRSSVSLRIFVQFVEYQEDYLLLLFFIRFPCIIIFGRYKKYSLFVHYAGQAPLVFGLKKTFMLMQIKTSLLCFADVKYSGHRT